MTQYENETQRRDDRESSNEPREDKARRLLAEHDRIAFEAVRRIHKASLNK